MQGKAVGRQAVAAAGGCCSFLTDTRSGWRGTDTVEERNSIDQAHIKTPSGQRSIRDLTDYRQTRFSPLLRALSRFKLEMEQTAFINYSGLKCYLGRTRLGFQIKD